MSDNFSELPYRKNVSCIVFQKGKFLLVQPKGWSKNFWKFPQGGVKKGESLLETVKRELNEEVKIKPYRIIGQSRYKNKYDWDEKSIRLAGSRWRGQIQRFFVVEFLGNPKDVEIDPKEIQAFKWVRHKELFENITHNHPIFSGYVETIKKVLKEFKNTLED